MGAFEWGTVGVNDQYLNENEVKVWPNPTEGKFKVQSLQFKVGVHKVEIEDLFGNVVFAKEILGDPNPLEFDVTNLPPGIYLVGILLGNQNFTKKLIKVSHR